MGFVLAGATLVTAQPPLYQWINVAPYVTATQDSVWFCENGTLLGDFFPGEGAFHFREASRFFGPGSPGMKTFAASKANNCDADNIVASVDVEIAADKNYQFILTGVYDPASFPPNPDGVATDLAFVVNDLAVNPDGRGHYRHRASHVLD